MGKYKRKAIQAYLGIFMHIPAYLDIIRQIQAYSEPCVTLTYSEPCVTLTYSEPWQIQNQTCIQNPGKFITRRVCRILVYSEPWFVQNSGIFITRGIFMTLIYSEPRHIQNQSLIRPPEHFGEIANTLYEINTINVFNTGVIFTSIAFILCRKSIGAQWAGSHEF